MRSILVQVVASLIVSGAMAQAAFVPAPAADLGRDVMKPMGKLFKEIGTNIGDGSKNAAAVQSLAKINDYIDIAVVTKPDTKAYAGVEAAVGVDNAKLKYESVLKSLKVTSMQLSVTLTNVGTAVCGDPCTVLLGDMKSLRGVGHNSFEDEP